MASSIPTVSNLVGEKPVAVALSIEDPAFDDEIKESITNAESRWLKNDEVLAILETFQIQGVNWPKEPAEKPQGGKLFIFSRRSCRGFRSDKHNWRKKQDGRTVKETHEKLKVGDKERLNCYYAHAEGTDGLQRRCYWILESIKDDVVLVHYRCTVSSRAGQRASSSHGTVHAVTAAASGPSSRPKRAAAQRARIGSRYSALDSDGEEEYPDITDDTKDSDYRLTEESDSYKLEGGLSFFPSLNTPHHHQLQYQHQQQQAQHQQAQQQYTHIHGPARNAASAFQRVENVFRDDSFGAIPFLAGLKAEAGLPSLAQQFQEAQEKSGQAANQGVQAQGQQQQRQPIGAAGALANNANPAKSPRKLGGDPFGSGNFLAAQMSLGIEGGGLSGILQSGGVSTLLQALNNDQLDASNIMPSSMSWLQKLPTVASPQQVQQQMKDSNIPQQQQEQQQQQQLQGQGAHNIPEPSINLANITDEQVRDAILRNDTHFFSGLSFDQLSGVFSEKIDQDLQEFMLKNVNSNFLRSLEFMKSHQQPIAVPALPNSRQQRGASAQNPGRKPNATVTSGSMPGFTAPATGHMAPQTHASASAAGHHETKQAKVETLRRIRFTSDSGGSSIADVASLPLSQQRGGLSASTSVGDGGVASVTNGATDGGSAVFPRKDDVASRQPITQATHHHAKQRKNPTAAPSPPSQQDRLAAAAAQASATVAAHRQERLQQARQVRHSDAMTTRGSDESQAVMITPLNPNGLLRFTSHVVNLMPQENRPREASGADGAAMLMKDMSIDVKTQEKEGHARRSAFGSDQDVGSTDREQSMNSLLDVVAALSGDLDAPSSAQQNFSK